MGLGRIRSWGGPLGSQCNAALSSAPPTALGPIKGLAASNFACPQDVKEGRTRSSTPFMRANPGSVPSAYCIQIPDRSWESGEAAAGATAGGLVVLDREPFWASTFGKRVSVATRTPSELVTRCRIPISLNRLLNFTLLERFCGRQFFAVGEHHLLQKHDPRPDFIRIRDQRNLVPGLQGVSGPANLFSMPGLVVSATQCSAFPLSSVTSKYTCV